MESKKFLTAEEVATEYGLSAENLQQFVDGGDLRALADRGTWKYRRDELDGLVQAGRIQFPSMEFAVPISETSPDSDDVSYIELDEEALAGATESSEGEPAIDVEEAEAQSDWFVPSDAAEMSSEEVEQPSIAAGSDSDVRIASGFEPRAEDSGILLDFNVDAGATVSSSGSSLRLPQAIPEVSDNEESADAVASDWDEPVGLSGDSSVVGMSGGESGIQLGEDSDVKLPVEESGILIDEGSHVGSSILAGPADDSGLTLEPGSGIKDDSGISLSTGDSGISLMGDDADSGITLGHDSGLSLEAGDSGISLGNARTMADEDLLDGDRTQTLNLADDSDDSSFDINLDDGDATAELLLGDEDDADEVSATVVKKGRSKPGGLSAAFELDDESEVEDLEISQDLDAGVEDDIEEMVEDEEVFETSDETFGEEAAVEDDEDYLEPVAKKKVVTPKEPAWGMGMTIGLVACTLFLAVNTVILVTGVSTMWSGNDAEAPGGVVVQTVGDLMK